MPLATTTLASSSATVTFSSISQSYRDLVIVSNAFQTGGTSDIWVRYNGDTGNNYSRVYMGGSGSGSGYSGTNQDVVNYVAYATTTNENTHLIHIMDYSTDKHKTNLSRTNTPSNSVSAYAGRWASTAAITSILFGTNGGNFAAGSTFSLYGVSA